MGCCGGGNVDAAAAALNDMVAFATNDAAPVVLGEGTTVRMEYIGEEIGARTFYGKGTQRQYRAGREPLSRYHDVAIPDVEHFVNLGLFRVVEAAPLMAAAVADDAAPVPIEPRVTDRPRPKGRRGG